MKKEYIIIVILCLFLSVSLFFNFRTSAPPVIQPNDSTVIWKYQIKQLEDSIIVSKRKIDTLLVHLRSKSGIRKIYIKNQQHEYEKIDTLSSHLARLRYLDSIWARRFTY